ncbi:MAG: hypothetical protein KKE57_01895 [Proteobacteria bacterium]|nr:hypothetical protein [Pseudomonadota bacterium]
MLTSEIKPRKRMAIISSYFANESYGLLGPQIAATIIQENTPYECIVIAVCREDDKALLKDSLAAYFGHERPIVGFSALSGRQDLFSLAKELKDGGALTILAGPQADVDYLGEEGWEDHAHRFKGLSNYFSFALHGPAEQVIPFLQDVNGKAWREAPGILSLSDEGRILHNTKKSWEAGFLRRVLWNNIYRLGTEGLTPLPIQTAQVLQHIGCPHAARSRWAEIDYPVSLVGKEVKKVRVLLRGCSFCDVAIDKGFHGSLDIGSVLSQIHGLPEMADGRKIPFELINENALPGLPHLLKEVRANHLALSQINLTLRADWFVRGEEHLREALQLANETGLQILLSSVGFESFDDRILANLNKGLTVETNLKAIGLMRQLKEEFPKVWKYARQDGAIHGFIHPTPWDTAETSASIQGVIGSYALPFDILPDHSIPLIIHHASALGDWIRKVEKREKIQFKREVTVIGWWQVGDRFTL